MTLNEFDRQILSESLSDLHAMLREAGPHIAPPAAIRENTTAIQSVKQKLKRITHEPQDFSAQELKVMYWAVYDLRDVTREFLDEAPLSDPDRAISVETHRACNRLLRLLADCLARGGIDIRKLFPD